MANIRSAEKQRRQAENDAEHGARRIEHSMEAEGAASTLLACTVSDQGIAWRGSYALAKTIHDASGQDHAPA